MRFAHFRLIGGLGTLTSVTTALAMSACGSDPVPVDPGEPCVGPNGPCVEIAPGPDGQEEAQAALINARPGDIILFRAGIHEFQSDLSLDVDGVTIRGEGIDDTVLSFAGQVEGAQGLLVTADDFTIEDIAIEDTVGDALKIEGTSGVTIRRTRAEWTAGADTDNGAYGLYPVQCTDVLIEDSVARGASDAGIYVGQSENIIVRRNRAELNVAGIEIENSNNADVYENVATGNTGGILVFNLPGLQVANGAGTRVFDNVIEDNNTDNFAPEGNIVGQVPRGTGMVILAAHKVEIFDNTFDDHSTGHLAMVSFLATQIAFDDPDYDPYVDTVFIHDNTFRDGGYDFATTGLSFLMVQALSTIQQAPIQIPDLVFFGFIDPDKADPTDPELLLPEFNLCFQGNQEVDAAGEITGDATFANLDFDNANAAVTTELSPYDCVHPPLPEVSIPGVE